MLKGDLGLYGGYMFEVLTTYNISLGSTLPWRPRYPPFTIWSRLATGTRISLPSRLPLRTIISSTTSIALGARTANYTYRNGMKQDQAVSATTLSTSTQ